jgi:hypothetical protein
VTGFGPRSPRNVLRAVTNPVAPLQELPPVHWQGQHVAGYRHGNRRKADGPARSTSMAPAQLFRDERCIAARYFGVPSHDGGWPETRQRAGDEEDGAARAEEEDP